MLRGDVHVPGAATERARMANGIRSGPQMTKSDNLGSDTMHPSGRLTETLTTLGRHCVAFFHGLLGAAEYLQHKTSRGLELRFVNTEIMLEDRGFGDGNRCAGALFQIGRAHV